MDFSRLVLGPAMAVFGRPVTVNPVVSQPNGATYAARGVYRAQPIDLALDSGAMITTTKHTLGIQRSAFTVQIHKGDLVTLDDGRVFTVDRYHPDGQGGADLTLLLNEPAPATP